MKKNENKNKCKIYVQNVYMELTILVKIHQNSINCSQTFIQDHFPSSNTVKNILGEKFDYTLAELSVFLKRHMLFIKTSKKNLFKHGI